MTMVEIIDGNESTGIVPGDQRGVQENIASAIAINNTLCDTAYLESLNNQITGSYDKNLLQNVMKQWSENTALIKEDIQVKDGRLYLCGYAITNILETQEYSNLKNPTYIMKQGYQEYFKSLIELTQKLTGETLDFPWNEFENGTYNGDGQKLIDKLNTKENKKILDTMYAIIGSSTIPLGVDNEGNIIYCGLLSFNRYFYRQDYGWRYIRPVVSKCA